MRPLADRRSSWWRRVWDGLLTVTILSLLVVLAVRLDDGETGVIEGRAVVNDGDSLTISGQRVRLRGIDAPEYDQTCKRYGALYPCGREARDALSELTEGRAVSCSTRNRDRYGRLLANCVAGGVDLGRHLVASGWAVSYGGYAAEETAARRNEAGLWAGTFDRPRDWRTMHDGTADSEHSPSGPLDLLRSFLNFNFRQGETIFSQ